MWFFMYTCYITSLMTFALLVTAFIQSLMNFTIMNANNVVFMILTCIMYAFSETLIIFFFVGTGVSIRDYTQQHNLPPTFHQQSIAIKRRVYPSLMMNMLFLIILFVLVGAVDTGRCPVWIYQGFFIFCLFNFVRIKIIQNNCFRDNTAIILQMSGLK